MTQFSLPGSARLALGLAFLAAAPGSAAAEPAAARQAFEIQVIDDASGRGIPLVELETVDHQRFITDNAGRVAFGEADLFGHQVFFSIRSHGYEAAADGFGFRGLRVTPEGGGRAVVKLHRRNVAERLCRLTGSGRFRDSVSLGYEIPAAGAGLRAEVVGQDSVQAAVFQGKIHWFWGDTLRSGYPLGLFRTAGATSSVEEAMTGRIEEGIAYDYFAEESGFARVMMPYPEHAEGVIWITGVCVVPDQAGHDRLVCHFARRQGLERLLEHGIAVYNDDRDIFEPAAVLPLSETWRFPDGHPSLIVDAAGRRVLAWGEGGVSIRVPARYESLFDADSYEAFSCVAARQGGEALVIRRAAGTPDWAWRRDGLPGTATLEAEWRKSGALQPDECRYSPADAADPAHRVQIHTGTVRWNPHRERWVLIGVEVLGGPSNLGEVWYAEALEPTGPFARGVRIVTHDRKSFYNVCQHEFLDRDNGRMIFFEGTYTNSFSGNEDATPRYEYNQILYRLDLDSPALAPAFVASTPTVP